MSQAVPMAAHPVTVAVLGSCISRDVFNTRFNPDYKSMWVCGLMQNQSSLISMMSEPYEIPEELLGEDMTPYARQQVRNDVSREFLQRVVEQAPDYLVVDFFGDVHFGVLEVEDGRFITDNRWMLHKTGWYRERKEAGGLARLNLQSDPGRYLELWQQALARLVDFVAEHLPGTTVVVHRGRNTSRWIDEDGTTRSMRRRRPLHKIDVEEFNRTWRLLDDLACRVDGWLSVDLSEVEYPSFVGHPWGVFYVHYTLDYYDELLAALNGLHLQRALEPGSTEQAMVAQMTLARQRAHRRLAAEAAETARLRAEVAEQRRRLAKHAQPVATAPPALPKRILRRVRSGLTRRS